MQRRGLGEAGDGCVQGRQWCRCLLGEDGTGPPTLEGTDRRPSSLCRVLRMRRSRLVLACERAILATV